MGSSWRGHIMKTMILVSFFATVASAAPEARFSCSECVDEMHKLGWMVKMAAVPIHDYLAANYCPTLNEDQQWCEEALSRYYVGALFAVVEHYFVDGAIHVCQTGGACDAFKEYTCDECILGLEWVEAYIEDPIMIAEYVVYLEHNFCQDGWEGCKEHAIQDFPAMHMMAMEKFFIPVEICNGQEVCGAPPPTKP